MKKTLILLVMFAVLFGAGLFALAQESTPEPVGDPAAAVQVDCATLGNGNTEAAYFVGLGNAFFRQRNLTRAIESYTCAVQYNPNYAPAYVNRGYAFATQGNEGAAEDDYNRALALDETLVTAYNNRGVLYTGQGRFGLALTDFDLAIALNPDYVIAYNNRAVVHAAEGNYDFALADLEAAIAIDPDYPAPHATLGVVYTAMAAQSYNEYRRLTGSGARLPAGEPDAVFLSLADSLETGNFSVWLPLLNPAE